MKRGKDDEEMRGPMFPRLHVNDTDKGGPRAPPRNKMALYERLSVPSQRCNPGALPLNTPSNPSNLASPALSIQGSGFERSLHLSHHVSPSRLPNPSEKSRSSHYNSGNSIASVQLEKKSKLQDEDDFTVPVFVQAGVVPNHHEAANKAAASGPRYSGHLVGTHHVTDRDPKLFRPSANGARQKIRKQNEENMEACVSSKGHSVISSTILPSQEKLTVGEEDIYGSPNQHCHDHPLGSLMSSDIADVPMQHKPASWLLPNDIRHRNSTSQMIMDSDKGRFSSPRSNSISMEAHSKPDKLENKNDHCVDKTCVSPQFVNGDKVHETPDNSISLLPISPDDIVKMIGQKHFWKARKVIFNQQRVFAVQVFELHRLIKVQQLFAGSPHLLLEDTINKPSMKSSPGKKLSSDCVITPSLPATKWDGDNQELNQKTQSSAENAVVKASYSGRKVSQASSPHLEKSNPIPAPADSKMNPWGFPHPFGHQWLVPIMSPSEGLLYKPYAMPGFMGSSCGGCGSFGGTLPTAHAMNPSYGFSAPHNHGCTPFGQAYFPAYGLPIMNPAISGSAVEQMNHFSGPNSDGEITQLSIWGEKFAMQQQSSSNASTRKGGGLSQVTETQASKDASFQGSTASSHQEKVKEVHAYQAAIGSDKLNVFPKAFAAYDGSRPQESEQPAKAIKVVPFNRRSASESAARIFKSIQEERKQYESA